MPQAGSQGLLTRWSAAARAGYGLFIGEAGDLAVWLGDGTGTVERLSTGTPLRAHDWYFVAATYDDASGRVCLYQEPVRRWPVEASRAVVERMATVRPRSAAATPFLMASYLTSRPGDARRRGRAFQRQARPALSLWPGAASGRSRRAPGRCIAPRVRRGARRGLGLQRRHRHG